MNFSTLIRKSRNFASRTRFEQAWFFPAWIVLGMSRFTILFIPFRRLATWLGERTDNAWVPLADSLGETRARSIARVIAMAAAHTPWESNCFAQAVTARILLGLHGVPYGIYFGVERNAAGELKAHAWVASGRVRVTGGTSFGQFAVVGCFVSPCLAHAMRNWAKDSKPASTG